MSEKDALGTNLTELLVPHGASLLDALAAINEGAREIAFVMDDAGTVIGTLTDGDIRRALLGGAELRSCCLPAAMCRDFQWVHPSTSRAEVLDLMLARGVTQIPVLNEAGHLVGLHLLPEFLVRTPRPNWAVLMAGGRGMRLRPITDHMPKPMVKVAGRPILERLVLHLVGAGIQRVFISIGYLGHQIREHFGDGEGFGCRIDYLEEELPLGTGGALSLLPELPKHPTLVMNGDLVTQFDLGALFGFHEEGRFLATMGVRSHSVEIPFGVAVVQDRRLIALREKPTEEVLVNTGMYVLSPEAVSMIPAGQMFPITRLFETCLERGLPVGACPVEEDWMDVGRPDQLRSARGEL